MIVRIAAAATLAAFAIYAFASVPLVNSAPTFLGPVVRIVVVAGWLYLAVRRASASPGANQLSKGVGGGILPITLFIIAFVIDPKWSADTLALFVAVLTYSTICCFFALPAGRYSKAVGIGFIVLAAQIGVDGLLYFSGLYGPYRFHI